MSSPSPSPRTSHDVENIVVQLQFRAPPLKQASGSNSKARKTAPAKGKLETKNKELSFKFDRSDTNYLSFLTTLLKKHGHDKYTPVVQRHRFGIRVCIGAKKPKKDAIVVDDKDEYKDLVDKILDEGPSKLMVYLDLEEVKQAAKAADSGSENGGQNSDEESGDQEKTALERELGRLRGLLEKKYANPADSGYTYVTNDGEKVPLTPTMMSEWARFIYDGLTTLSYPPNTLQFDPRTRSRSLFHSPKAPSADDRSKGPGEAQVLQSLSSVFQSARLFFGGPMNEVPMTPSNANRLSMLPTPSSGQPVESPPRYSPSKLPAFLRYAEEKLGIKNARISEDTLEHKGYGPDILPDVDDKDIIACGFTAGDAIRLKRGAAQWWYSGEAKRVRLDNALLDVDPFEPSHDDVDKEDTRRRLRFEKRFPEGGSESVFGPGIVPGMNVHADKYSWWFFNDLTDTVEKVPDGFIPELAAEYIDPNEIEDF